MAASTEAKLAAVAARARTDLGGRLRASDDQITGFLSEMREGLNESRGD